MADTLSAELLEFPKKDNRRFLHAVYRVGDLERIIKYITHLYETTTLSLDHSTICYWGDFTQKHLG
ncbi:putative lactoylglutathione lyase [Helianthus annuus]|nr:putative lactoylglutathione lyase [Helianthus annuus]KAJ0940219.1 putative lactoylglutathione lyase [Helianthus annuus]